MDSAAQRALAIPEILFEIYRWIMMADPLYTSNLPDSDGSWRSLCEYAALALLPYTTVNKLWLNVAIRCTQHSWQNMIATGQFLQDVLAQAPTICRQGLANSVSIATISTVSHRCAAAADAPFRGWSFPNMMMLTIVLGDHADGTRELCSMLSTRSHVPAIQCPHLTVLSIFRSGNGADLDEDPECDCGQDGVYALPEDWRALFKQITTLFPSLQFIMIGDNVHVDRRTLRQLPKRLPRLRNISLAGADVFWAGRQTRATRDVVVGSGCVVR